MKRVLTIALLCSTAIACSPDTMRKELGIKKSAPDEFMVLSRPELVVPPNFDLPEPGEKTQQFDRNQVRDETKKALIGIETVEEVTDTTEAESVLLERAGVDTVDTNIRDILNEEYNVKVQEKEEEGKQLLGIKGLLEPVLPDHEAKAELEKAVLNPDEELKRLRDERQAEIKEELGIETEEASAQPDEASPEAK